MKQCVRVAELRKLGYISLEHWMSFPENLYVGRNGRVFIKEEDESRVFHYSRSKWANPYKVTKQQSAPRAVVLYLHHLVSDGLIDDVYELEELNLGCFCKDGEVCHASALSDVLNMGYSSTLKKYESIANNESEVVSTVSDDQCEGVTSNGSRCRRKTKAGRFCYQHK